MPTASEATSWRRLALDMVLQPASVDMIRLAFLKHQPTSTDINHQVLTGRSWEPQKYDLIHHSPLTLHPGSRCGAADGHDALGRGRAVAAAAQRGRDEGGTGGGWGRGFGGWPLESLASWRFQGGDEGFLIKQGGYLYLLILFHFLKEFA